MPERKISVCLSPALLPYYDLSQTIAVVIDVFRATTSMCYGLANGAEAIIPVAEVEECLAYRDHGYLLAAERDGKVVDGFDFGNSPFSYTADKVAGKTIVLTTTNGTRAIQHCQQAKQIVIGAFANIDILANWLLTHQEDVLFVCSGWKNHVNLEDTIFAGAMAKRLQNEQTDLDDSAILAMRLYEGAKHDLRGSLQDASHAKRMQRLDISRDVEFCLRQNTSPAIPLFENGKLINAAKQALVG